AEKVKLAVYYNSKNPEFRRFMVAQLYPTSNKIPNILDISMVPFGDGKEIKAKSGFQYYCTNGAEECLENLIQACAVATENNPEILTSFVGCLSYYDGSVDKIAKYCSNQIKDYEKVEYCLKNTQGLEVMHYMAKKTRGLQPKMSHSPWITVNGEHSEFIQQQAMENLLQLVCSKYKGTLPYAC
ncbi:predicted protein, partial [Nematostella vectensis]